MGNNSSIAVASTISLTDYVSKSEYRSKTLLSIALESGRVKDLKCAIQTVRSADAVHALSHEKANARLLDYLTQPISFQSDEEFIDQGSMQVVYKRTPLMIALDMQHFELGTYLRDEIARVKKVQMTFDKHEKTPNSVSVLTFSGGDRIMNGVQKVGGLVKDAMDINVNRNLNRNGNARNTVSASDLLSDDPETLEKMKSWSTFVNSKPNDKIKVIQ